MPRSRLSRSTLVTPVLLALATIPLSGCSGGVGGVGGGFGEDYTHGYVQSEDSIAQITPGSSREQVLLVLGSPSTTATTGIDAFYYITQKTARSFAFMEPGLVDQRVLAVYFDDKSKVKEVANYGLQDGKIFDFISRRTKTTGQDYGILFQVMHAGPSLGSMTGAK